MSGNRRSRNPAREPSLESIVQARAELETLWQRVVTNARLAGDASLGMADMHDDPLSPDLQRAAAGERPPGDVPTRHVDGWTFVGRQLPPEPLRADGSAADPSRRYALSMESIRTANALRARRIRRDLLLRGSPSPDAQPAAQRADSFQAPIAQGPVTLFGGSGTDDGSGPDDHDGADTAIPDADTDGFDDWFVRTFSTNMLNQIAVQRSPVAAWRRHTALAAPPPTRSKRGAPDTSVVVRQPWNRTRAWRPYVYQPLPTGAAALADRSRQLMAHTDADAGQSQQYALHAGVGPVALDCTNADDMGRGSLNNMFFPNSSLFITSRPRNVHLELSLVPSTDVDPAAPSPGSSAPGRRARHCVVERIFVMSSMAKPPCTELMVFASSRRCNFSELRKYDDYTFAQYEQLSASIAASPAPPPDPLPIAYFWLPFEDEYEQLQVLPQGVSCRYLYVKLLRGDGIRPTMSLRLIRVFGWDGPRSFSETALC
ncbi:hypothetical protein H4R18_005906 [Coemansia javaensis]|uniref:Uncharacterized protein n=1 Tax=Coemansia javaensis TaxID=2761396 RepID=A0A9W8H501_9FUNG|nr:hypothetical protein H4R18_005906 [Coemansia javaensis]